MDQVNEDRVNEDRVNEDRVNEDRTRIIYVPCVGQVKMTYNIYGNPKDVKTSFKDVNNE